MLLDGKRIADQIQDEIRQQIEKRELRTLDRPPCLAVLIVGNHPASEIYVKRKTEACAAVGIKSIRRQFPSTVSAQELLHQIDLLNADSEVDGILLQLPIPGHISPIQMMHAIHPDKDIDGFHPVNIGKLLIGEKDGFIPCTPLGIQTLMDRSQIEVAGKDALIVGRSNIVGKPMAALLMQSGPGGDATVTVAHRHSKDLPELCRRADILIVAIGQPGFIRGSMVKEGAVVIDVGINKVPDPSKKMGYRIQGDVNFEEVAPKCSWITPVPKGVGPMTIAMLLQNTLTSYERKR